MFVVNKQTERTHFPFSMIKIEPADSKVNSDVLRASLLFSIVLGAVALVTVMWLTLGWPAERQERETNKGEKVCVEEKWKKREEEQATG